MAAVLSLLVVLIVSLLVVRVATVALTLTGISQPLARFQARSAFTGAGFTTAESEKVVQHPVRRRVIMLLMLLGNAGIVTAVSSLILTFVGTGDASGITGTPWFRILTLGVGLAVLWSIGHSRWIDEQLSKLITAALKRWTDLEIRDYAGLLHLSDDYAVVEMQVAEGDWIADRELNQLQLADEGVLVLGIEKHDGKYLGVATWQNQAAGGRHGALVRPAEGAHRPRRPPRRHPGQLGPSRGGRRPGEGREGGARDPTAGGSARQE